MARLILINGAPGSGKSTLARRYGQDHPLALALDLDTVRGLLGGWLDRPVDAGLAARRLALAMARVHLLSGRDVLVPQFLGRLDFVLELDALARELDVELLEIALLSDPVEAGVRFARRSARPQTREHRDAAALQERSGGAAGLGELYDRLLTVIAMRPATRTVLTVDGEVEQTYRRLLDQIDLGSPRPAEYNNLDI
jgi:predicted kinase